MSMMTVPIVFAIDQHVVMQCGVTITSLLLNAKEGTFYEIYILFEGSKLDREHRDVLAEAFSTSQHCRLSFVDVGDVFADSEGLAVGHITTATYFRLAIPTLLPQYDKVIYSDIDIVFQQDLSDLYQESLKHDELLAAALDLSIDREIYFDSPMVRAIGKDSSSYFNAGFLVMNSRRLRQEEIQTQLSHHARIKYEQNDQDVLNIVCGGDVQVLSSLYNFQPSHFSSYLWGRKKSDLAFDAYFRGANLHYTGPEKPWNSLQCVASDAWWHYYRQSPFFEDSFYFKRQYEQIESSRNDYRQKSIKDLLVRVLVNVKHRLSRS